MLTWTSIAYGAALSAVAAALLVGLVWRERRPADLVVAAAGAAAGALAWNAILHRVGGREFFADAPVTILPASWQDAGSGVFSVGCAAVALGLGPMRKDDGARVALTALLCGLAAFLVDVYLY